MDIRIKKKTNTPGIDIKYKHVRELESVLQQTPLKQHDPFEPEKKYRDEFERKLKDVSYQEFLQSEELTKELEEQLLSKGYVKINSETNTYHTRTNKDETIDVLIYSENKNPETREVENKFYEYIQFENQELLTDFKTKHGLARNFEVYTTTTADELFLVALGALAGLFIGAIPSVITGSAVPAFSGIIAGMLLGLIYPPIDKYRLIKKHNKNVREIKRICEKGTGGMDAICQALYS